MVFSGEGEDLVTMGRERAKTRHNFTLPDLKWGVQRSLRCTKLRSHCGDDDRNRILETERWRSEEGIEEFGEKIMSAEVKPWNLRKRRRAAWGAKFVSRLTKKEMEDDYMKMMGHRPPRRPKKRLRTLQKHIDLLHPALYFTQVITEDIYEVPNAAETKKR